MKYTSIANIILGKRVNKFFRALQLSVSRFHATGIVCPFPKNVHLLFIAFSDDKRRINE